MTKKSTYYALAVVVLMGGMSVAAWADYNWTAGAYMPDPVVSSHSEQNMEPSAAAGIREPVETGSLPDSSGSSFKEDTGEFPTVELGGQLYRPGIDLGGGGD